MMSLQRLHGLMTGRPRQHNTVKECIKQVPGDVRWTNGCCRNLWASCKQLTWCLQLPSTLVQVNHAADLAECTAGNTWSVRTPILPTCRPGSVLDVAWAADSSCCKTCCCCLNASAAPMASAVLAASAVRRSDRLCKQQTKMKAHGCTNKQQRT